MTYTLTLTHTQARTVSTACEVLARLGMGQFKDAFDCLPLRKDMDWSAWHDDMEQISRILSKHMQGGIDGIRSSTGISNASEEARSAMDLHQVIRHRLSWDRAIAEGVTDGTRREWPAMMQTWYDKPAKYSEEPLAKMEKKNERRNS